MGKMGAESNFMAYASTIQMSKKPTYIICDWVEKVVLIEQKLRYLECLKRTFCLDNTNSVNILKGKKKLANVQSIPITSKNNNKAS